MYSDLADQGSSILPRGYEDDRINRRFEVFMMDRNMEQNQSMYSKVFSLIKSKLLTLSETELDINILRGYSVDSEESIESAQGIIDFNKKYLINETLLMINNFKKSIVEIHNKKIITEIEYSNAKEYYSNFSNKVLAVITDISDTNSENSEDEELSKLLFSRIEWYYSHLNIEKLKKDLLLINEEYSNVKGLFNEIYGILPATTCQICLEKEITHFLDPCGHTICKDCVDKNKNIKCCHYCRTVTKSFKRLYL